MSALKETNDTQENARLKVVHWEPSRLENGKWSLGYPGCSFGPHCKKNVLLKIAMDPDPIKKTKWNWPVKKSTNNVIVQWNLESNDKRFYNRMVRMIANNLNNMSYYPHNVPGTNATILTSFKKESGGDLRFSVCYPFGDTLNFLNNITSQLDDLLDMEEAKYEDEDDMSLLVSRLKPDMWSRNDWQFIASSGVC